MWLFPPFRLDPFDQRLLRGEERVNIKPKAFALLRYLVERPERLISKQELLEALWPGVQVEPGVLKTQMHELRQLLGDQVKPARFIETVPSVGYRFVASVKAGATTSSTQAQRHDGRLRPSDILVGREGELASLEHKLGRALQGERQVVFVVGEAGIGKTMLVNRFLAPLRNNVGLAVGWGQCIEQYGVGEAYLPILEALSRLARTRGSEPLRKALQRNAPTWFAHMPELIEDPGQRTLERSAATPDRMLRELAQALPALADLRPLILCLEDLHWADYSTLAFLSYLARQSDRARLLVLGTFRPQEVRLTRHPLWEIEQSLLGHELCEEIALRHLEQSEITRLIDVRFSPHHLPSQLGQELRAHTSGNPLFLNRVLDAMVKRGVLCETGGYWQLTAELQTVTRDVPSSIAGLIEREVVRLEDVERNVLEAASIAGAEFRVAAVAAVLAADLLEVEELCARWSQAGRFLQRQEAREGDRVTGGSRFEFIHSLYQQVISSHIAPARRAKLHAGIGAWLEATYATELRSVAAELAMHFECAGEPARAITYRQLAGEQALGRCAYQEAIQHLNAAQALVGSLPEGLARQRVELTLLLALGIPVAMTRGYASVDVEQVYVRARDLCCDLGDEELLLRVVIGLSVCYVVRGRYTDACELAEQAKQLAESERHASFLQEANLARLLACFYLGVPEMRDLVARTIDLFGVEQSGSEALSIQQDLQTTASFLISWPLWVLGHPDQALYRGEQALALATSRGDHFAMSQSLAYLVIVHIFRGESGLLRTRAAACNKLCKAHGFPFFQTTATIALGGLQVADGDVAGGITMMRQSLKSRADMGAVVNGSFWSAHIAEAYAHTGMLDEAVAMLDEAFVAVRERKECWWEPELYRLAGDLSMSGRSSRSLELVHRPGVEQPEAAFRHALDLARNRGAKSLELRAATSLSRLWRTRGKAAAARQLLTGIYDWFREGHDTGDMKAAREELERLGASTEGTTRAPALPRF